MVESYICLSVFMQKTTYSTHMTSKTTNQTSKALSYLNFEISLLNGVEYNGMEGDGMECKKTSLWHHWDSLDHSGTYVYIYICIPENRSFSPTQIIKEHFNISRCIPKGRHHLHLPQLFEDETRSEFFRNHKIHSKDTRAAHSFFRCIHSWWVAPSISQLDKLTALLLLLLLLFFHFTNFF